MIEGFHHQSLFVYKFVELLTLLILNSSGFDFAYLFTFLELLIQISIQYNTIQSININYFFYSVYVSKDWLF